MKLWERGKKIGAGGEATVYEAHLLPDHPLFLTNPSLPVAVKSAIYTESSSLLHEQFLLKEFIDCPQIINIFSSEITHEEDGDLTINILMEYAKGGSLHDRIDSCVRYNGYGIPLIQAREYTISILHGLKYIHSRGYVHCDVKTDNILIVNGRAKIADLGLTMRAGRFPGKMIGTCGYMAPESSKWGDYGKKVDIWGLGCCLFEMITGEKQWRFKSGEEIERISKESRMSDDVLSFLSKCLVEDPEERWDVDSLLLHRFIVRKIGDSSPGFHCCVPGEA